MTEVAPHRFDKDESCHRMSENSNDRFLALTKYHRIETRQATESQDKEEHIDFLIRRNQPTFSTIDIKAIKRSGGRKAAQKENDHEWLWIEFQGRYQDYETKKMIPKTGWLYSNVDFIGFEQPDGFLIVNREDLAILCDKIVDKENYISCAADAIRKVYRRDIDIIAKIHLSDIKESRSKHGVEVRWYFLQDEQII